MCDTVLPFLRILSFLCVTVAFENCASNFAFLHKPCDFYCMILYSKAIFFFLGTHMPHSIRTDCSFYTLFLRSFPEEWIPIGQSVTCLPTDRLNGFSFFPASLLTLFSLCFLGSLFTSATCTRKCLSQALILGNKFRQTDSCPQGAYIQIW